MIEAGSWAPSSVAVLAQPGVAAIASAVAAAATAQRPASIVVLISVIPP